jgi:hypothetical protein
MDWALYLTIADEIDHSFATTSAAIARFRRHAKSKTGGGHDKFQLEAVRFVRDHRFKLHFIPTSSSWLNLVERLFAEITRQKIRRGVFHSVTELEAAIAEWINHRNANPKPFVWTATARSITLKRNRAKKVLANIAAGCK